NRGDVGEGDLGERRLLRMKEIRQRDHAVVGNFHRAEVCLAVPAVKAGRRGEAGEGVEHGGLAAPRKSNKADAHGGRLPETIAGTLLAMKCIAILLAFIAAVPAFALTPAQLRAAAHDYYEWQKREFPVYASDQGAHERDDKLTDYSAAAVAKRNAHVRALLERVRATDVNAWSKDDVIDWMLFRSQLEAADFPERVQHPEETDPQVYVGEASNAIFSLLKKEYAPPAVRARAATARLRAMPAMIEEGKKNL